MRQSWGPARQISCRSLHINMNAAYETSIPCCETTSGRRTLQHAQKGYQNEGQLAFQPHLHKI